MATVLIEQFFLDQARVGLNFGEAFVAELRRVRTAEFRDPAGDTEGDCRADDRGGAQAVSL